MAHLTVRQVLAEVDRILPNQYPEAQKRRWLTQAEGFVAGEIVGKAIPELLEDDWELLAEEPYGGMYGRYVEAQIHYANGETERYNNAGMAWNQGFLEFRNHFNRQHLCERGMALKLC